MRKGIQKSPRENFPHQLTSPPTCLRGESAGLLEAQDLAGSGEVGCRALSSPAPSPYLPPMGTPAMKKSMFPLCMIF